MSLDKLKNKQFDPKKYADSLENKSSKDERFWKLGVDKKQNGEAVIRFLTGVEGEEDTPIVRYDTYFIKGDGDMYIAPALENCGGKSFGREVASRIWKKYKETNNEEYKKSFKSHMPAERYIANIYVVDDPANPENNGKVFLFMFGREIKKMILSAMGVDDEDAPKFKYAKKREPFDVFCFWNGANFNLISYSESGFAINRSYKKSYFDDCEPLFDDDAKIEEVYSKVYSLKEFVDPSNYPTYEQDKEDYIEKSDYYDLFPEDYNPRERLEKSPKVNNDEPPFEVNNDDKSENDWDLDNDDIDDDVFSDISKHLSE